MEKQISKQRKKFNKEHDGMSDAEILRENLYAQQLTLNKLERIRINTSNLIWIIIIPAILLFFVYLVGSIF